MDFIILLIWVAGIPVAHMINQRYIIHRIPTSWSQESVNFALVCTAALSWVYVLLYIFDESKK